MQYNFKPINKIDDISNATSQIFITPIRGMSTKVGWKICNDIYFVFQDKIDDYMATELLRNLQNQIREDLENGN